SRRRHTRFSRDWSSDVCSSDLYRSQSFRSFEHLIADGTAFLGIAVEQRFRLTLLLLSEGELPRQIKRVLHARVHALPTRGAVDRSEERRVGKECRYGGAPCHGE